MNVFQMYPLGYRHTIGKGGKVWINARSVKSSKKGIQLERCRRKVPHQWVLVSINCHLIYETEWHCSVGKTFMCRKRPMMNAANTMSENLLFACCRLIYAVVSLRSFISHGEFNFHIANLLFFKLFVHCNILLFVCQHHFYFTFTSIISLAFKHCL